MRQLSLQQLLIDSTKLLWKSVEQAYAGTQTQPHLYEIIETPDEYKPIFSDPDARHQIGYIQGMADARDVTVQELLHEFLEPKQFLSRKYLEETRPKRPKD